MNRFYYEVYFNADFNTISMTTRRKINLCFVVIASGLT